jgi:very-short-patch-repair endonuclease
LRALKPRGVHCRGQAPSDRLIVDFACLAARVVIEVDGGQHNARPELATDTARDAHLRRAGFRVLRFWNNEVMGNLDAVLEVVLGALREHNPPSVI